MSNAWQCMVYLPLKGILQTLFALGRFQPEGASQIEDGAQESTRSAQVVCSRAMLSYRQGGSGYSCAPQGEARALGWEGTSGRE